MRFHGNYCGPNWSGGIHQQSVISNVPAIDDFDQTCKEHDASYASGHNLAEADLKFARNNISLNPKRLAAAIVVGAQGTFRTISDMTIGGNPRRFKPGQDIAENEAYVKSMQGPLTRAAVAQRKTLPPIKNRGDNGVASVDAKLAVGSKIRSIKPKIRLGSDTARVTGHDLLSAVDGPAAATGPELAVLWPMNPCYLTSTSLSMYTPFYDEYRIRKAVVTFHTKMPTTTSGEIWMTTTDNPTLNLYDTQSVNFVSKLMSTQNAVMGPIWSSLRINLNPKSGYLKTNPLTDASPCDSTAGDFLVYVQSSSTGGVLGYLMLEYDIEFRKRRYTSASSMLSTLSPTLAANVVENETHVVGAPVQLANLSSLTINTGATSRGAVFEIVYDSSTAFPSVWASTIYSTTPVNLTIKPGQKFYALLVQANASSNPIFRVFTNYASAIVAGSDYLVYNDTGAANIMPFQVTQVFASIAATLAAI